MKKHLKVGLGLFCLFLFSGFNSQAHNEICQKGMLLTVKNRVPTANGTFLVAGKKVQLLEVTSQPWGKFADVFVIDAAIEDQVCKLTSQRTTLAGVGPNTFLECSIQ